MNTSPLSSITRSSGASPVRSLRRAVLTGSVALALLAGACGSGEDIEAIAPGAPIADGETTEEGSDESTGEAVADDGDGDDAARNDEEMEDEAMSDGYTEIPNTPEPVDPRTTTPDAMVVAPDNPNVVLVRFTGGDPNCTAARVTVLRQTPDDVGLSLEVGITEDAMVRSCVAGEFPLEVAIDLGEPVADRPISAEQAAGEEPQLLTPDLSTDDIVGLTESEVQALADENLFEWRITRIDDESFAVTLDYNPGRLNVEIENGVVVLASLG